MQAVECRFPPELVRVQVQDPQPVLGRGKPGLAPEHKPGHGPADGKISRTGDFEVGD